MLVQRRQWHPTPALLPGKSHGQRSLVGCSPWGHEESDLTERLHFHFSLLCIEEGNGNPLQCSCLENPRDGVSQSRTRLKWLSSSIVLVPTIHQQESAIDIHIYVPLLEPTSHFPPHPILLGCHRTPVWVELHFLNSIDFFLLRYNLDAVKTQRS